MSDGPTVSTTMECDIPCVLIVEDDPDLAAIAEGMLRVLGFRSRHVWDAEKALVELVYRTPDLVLLDIFLPKMTGDDLLRVLPALDWVAKVPVIAMSAIYAPGTNIVRSLTALGVSGFLSKPFGLVELRAAIVEAGVPIPIQGPPGRS